MNKNSNYTIQLILLNLALILFSISTNAQEVRVIDNKGTLTTINKVTTSSTAPTDPVIGDVWYDDTIPAETIGKIYDGTSWKFLSRIGTTGSVFFAGTDGAPTEDNAQLLWDNANNKLYVGNPFNIADANKLTVNGTARAIRFRSSDGTVGNPAFKFSNDNDTGMYTPDLDQLSFTAGGVEAVRIEEVAGSSKVTIKETLELDAKLLDENDLAGTNGQILSATATGTRWIDSNNSNTVTTSNTAPTSPIEGDVWYDDTTPDETIGKIYDGTNWIYISRIGTPGSVFFAGTDGAPTQDSGQLFWDNAINNLHIGAILTSSSSNKVNVRGTVRATGYKANSATANRPAYTFFDDVNTGMYRIGVDQLGFSTDGINALVIDATQNVGIGTTPTERLDIDGKLRVRTLDDAATADVILTADNTTGIVNKSKINFGGRWTNTDVTTNLNTVAPTSIPLFQTENYKDDGTNLYTTTTTTLTVVEAGRYDIRANVSLISANERSNVNARIYVGATAIGAIASTGYIRFRPNNANSHNHSSLHLNEILQLNAGSVITIKTFREANTGDVFFSGANESSVMINKLR